jgi:hypothetical protein
MIIRTIGAKRLKFMKFMNPFNTSIENETIETVDKIKIGIKRGFGLPENQYN